MSGLTRILIVAGVLVVILAFFLIAAPAAFGLWAVTQNGEDTGGSTTTPLDGANLSAGPGDEVEFVMTHYYPCTKDFMKVHPGCDAGMEGDSTMATGAKAVYDPNSPMGFYAEYKGKKYYYSVAVAWKNTTPVLDFVTPGKEPKVGAYFDDKNQIFVALDHFGGCANNPKAMDVMATDEGYSKFFNNLKKAGLVTNRTEQNGCSSSAKPVVKGTIAEIIKAGSGG